MIESMKKEIDKRFLKGIAASRGIVIGKADEPNEHEITGRHFLY